MDNTNIISLSLIKAEVSSEEEFISELLTVFKQNIIEYINNAKKYLANENIIGIKEGAHKIAPLCEMLSLSDLYTLLKSIEAKCDRIISVGQVNKEVNNSVEQLQFVIQQIDKINKQDEQDSIN